MEQLECDLWSCQRPSAYRKERFLPEKDLNELIQQKRLSQLDLGPLVTTIVPNARKIFAIWMMARLYASRSNDDLRRLLEAWPEDTVLPLRLPDSQNAENADRKSLVASGTKRRFEFENPADCLIFESIQWFVQAPVFRHEHHDIPEQCPMPFTKFDEVSRTLFSDVYKAEFCQGHLEATLQPGTNERLYAIKILKPPKVDGDLQYNFGKELQALLQIRDIDPRIIWHVATYQRGESYAIIFPWADQGSLRNYWEQSLTPDSVTWALDQMVGLAEALDKLHNLSNHLREHGYADSLSCRHGDLKPENILVFNTPEGRAKLVITDVGLARFHMEVTAVRSRSTKFGATTAYIPPEFDLGKDRPTSRKFDIWSMGCVLLEFVVWLLYGGGAVKDFADDRPFPDRKFFDLRGNNPQIHPAVSSQVDKMRSDGKAKGKAALDDLLTLILDKLLQIEPDNRATAKELSKKLKAISLDSAAPAPAPAPALPSLGESAEKTLEERNIMALETIAEAARRWMVNSSTPDGRR